MSGATTATRSTTAAACIDASLVVRLIGGAPEVTSAWDRLVRSDEISLATAEYQLERSMRLPIELHGDAALHVRALELAGEHDLPATYDAHYLALAERYRVPLWTCDRRLHAAIGGRLPWVHLVS